jgi:outer membrane receptor protein involved in Fe transport
LNSIIGTTSETTKTDYSAFLPKLGVIYDFEENTSASLVYQRGYRSGGARNTQALGVVEYDPEYTDNLELALRSQSMGGDLITNANLFYMEWTDQQVEVGELNAGTLRIENAGESQLYGGELTVDYRATDMLRLNTGIGYVRTEFKEYTSGGTDFAGNEFANAPRWTASAGAEYDFGNGFVLLGDVSYTDSAFGDAQNSMDGEIKSYTLTNLSLTYDYDQLTAGVFVRNLFDKRYAETGGATTIRAGEPRFIGGYLEWVF